MKIHRFYAGNLLELMPDFPFKELNAVVLGGLKRVMSLKKPKLLVGFWPKFKDTTIYSKHTHTHKTNSKLYWVGWLMNVLPFLLLMFYNMVINSKNYTY